MTDEEKDLIKKAYVDKAEKKTGSAIFILILFSISWYFIALISSGEFDFGVIFEVASIVFLFVAKSNMGNYYASNAKKYVLFAIFAISWLLVYDILFVFSSINVVDEPFYFVRDYVLADFIPVIYLILLLKINRDLAKAENPDKYKGTSDWFYERLEKNNSEKTIRKP